jgi:hypothetical protein
VVGDEEDDFQHQGDDGRGDAVGPEQSVVEQDIDDHRSDEGEGERDEATDQEKEACDRHDDADEGHVVVGVENAHPGEGVAAGKGQVDEAENVVEAKYEEHEAEEKAGYEGDVLHRGLLECRMDEMHAGAKRG